MSFTLDDRRTWVRQFARNAVDSSEYPDAQVDRALQLAGDEWARIVRVPRQLSTLTLTAGSDVVPGLPDGCLPELILQTFLTLSGQLIDPKFFVGSYEQVLSSQAGRGPIENYFPVPSNSTSAMSGQPRMMGFIDQANAIVYPTPNDAFVIQMWWRAPLTAFTAGAQGAWSETQTYNFGDVVSLDGTLYTCILGNLNNTPPNSTYWASLGSGSVEDPGTLTFNLPDDHLRVIDTFGAPAFLQFTEPEKAYASGSFQQMQASAKQFAARNAGGRGGQVSIKETPR